MKWISGAFQSTRRCPRTLSASPLTTRRLLTSRGRTIARLIYSGSAEDGSGQWFYTLDVDRRIPHRVSSGITEQYLSVTVSNTTPRRLIASVATPAANLWTVPISNRIHTDADVSRFPRPEETCSQPSPSLPNFLLFLSSKGGADGLWKLKEDAVTELWKGSDGGVVSRTQRFPAMELKSVFRPAWKVDPAFFSCTPMGQTSGFLRTRLMCVAQRHGLQTASLSSVAGSDEEDPINLQDTGKRQGSPVRLVESACNNPMWSPDGRFIVYSEPLQGSRSGPPLRRPETAGPDTGYPRLLSHVDAISVHTRRHWDSSSSKEGPFIGGAGNFYAVDFTAGRETPADEPGHRLRDHEVLI